MRAEITELLDLDTSQEKYLQDITDSEFFGFPLEPILTAERNLRTQDKKSIAYLSMEYGLAPSIYHTFKTRNPIKKTNILSNHEVFSNLQDMDYYHFLPLKKILDLPIYGGGLGVLAGDTLKSAADLNLSLVGLGVLWNKGYFKQKFWFREGGQFPEETFWDPYSYPGLIPLKTRIKIKISGTEVILKLWKYYAFSYAFSSAVPLILLDSNVAENPQYFRELTNQLYRSENGWIKIAQRMILGIGGIRALNMLGYTINKYHLNEGHAALAYLENPQGLYAYTCHTPVEAGHDRFNFQELEAALGKDKTDLARKTASDPKYPQTANLSVLALNISKHVNGVAQKHGEVMKLQFPGYQDRIISITNGVHTHTWLSEPIKNLLLKYENEIGNWQQDPARLANVLKLKSNQNFREELWQAHLENKNNLAEFLKFWFFDKNTFTLGWARRFAAYKRPSLLFQNINRLIQIAKTHGPLQIVIAGKAHPLDAPASAFMDEIFEKINWLSGQRKILRVCFLENYDTYFGKLLTSCVDVWLNNPLPPFEASGSSGMKAILNGVLQLSTLDGWIVEAADKNIGRIFGYVPPKDEIGSEKNLKLEEDSKALYEKLDELVPLYYQTLNGDRSQSEWIDMMLNCLAAAGFFNTQRMVWEYNQLIWEK